MSRGAALPMMLFAMTMLSAIAVGGAYVSRQQAVSARITQSGSELEPAAEAVLVEAMVGWDSLARSEQPIGDVSPLPPGGAPGIRVDAWVTRVSQDTYWLVAEASGTGRHAVRRRIGLLVRVAGGFPSLVPGRAWSELP